MGYSATRLNRCGGSEMNGRTPYNLRARKADP
jgi:hypothetical protein